MHCKGKVVIRQTKTAIKFTNVTWFIVLYTIIWLKQYAWNNHDIKCFDMHWKVAVRLKLWLPCFSMWDKANWNIKLEAYVNILTYQCCKTIVGHSYYTWSVKVAVVWLYTPRYRQVQWSQWRNVWYHFRALPKEFGWDMPVLPWWWHSLEDTAWSEHISNIKTTYKIVRADI